MPTFRLVAPLIVAAGIALSGCTSSSQRSVLVQAEPKPYPCDLDLYTNASEVKRPFEKLCVIEAKGESFADDRGDAPGRALRQARRDGCACGATGLIVQNSYRDDDSTFRIKFHERMKATVYAVAIRYTDRKP